MNNKVKNSTDVGKSMIKVTEALTVITRLNGQLEIVLGMPNYS
jgi:hypothetical protein